MSLRCEWQRLGGENDAGPSQRSKAAALLRGDTVSLVGGRTRKVGVRREIWRLGLEERSEGWEQISWGDGPLVEGAAGATLGSTAFLFGGQFSPFRCTLLASADGHNDFAAVPWRGSGPTNKAGASLTAILGDRLLLFGGSDEIAGVSPHLWSFQPASCSWELLPCGPKARSFHAATALGGRLFVHGGQGHRHLLDDLWSFDLWSNRWEQLGRRGEAPPALRGHSMAAANGRLFLFGGLDDQGRTNASLYSYSRASGSWSRQDSSPSSAWPSGVAFGALLSLEAEPSFPGLPSAAGLRSRRSRTSSVDASISEGSTSPGGTTPVLFIPRADSHHQLFLRRRTSSHTSDAQLIEFAGRWREEEGAGLGNPAFEEPWHRLPGSVCGSLTDLPDSASAAAKLNGGRMESSRPSLCDTLHMTSLSPAPPLPTKTWPASWSSRLSEEETRDEGRQPLCGHRVGQCSQLLLLGGQTEGAVGGVEKLQVWLCCVMGGKM